MTDIAENRFKEAPQTFRAASEIAPLVSQAAVYRAKVFKSGNSLALRLTKALGLEAGMELEITITADGSYALRRVDAPKRKIDVRGFWGKAPGIKLAPREDFEERPGTIAAREAAIKALGST